MGLGVFLGDERILKLDCGNSFTALWMYRRPLKLALYVGELHGMRILSLLISILKHLRDTSQVFSPGYTLQNYSHKRRLKKKKKKNPDSQGPSCSPFNQSIWEVAPGLGVCEARVDSFWPGWSRKSILTFSAISGPTMGKEQACSIFLLLCL